MSSELLRLIVAVLAMTVAGSALALAARYGRASLRLGRAPGRILARHVTEVATGTAGLTIGYAAAIYGQLDLGADPIPPTARLVLYLISMLLLLAGVIEITIYQRVRARRYPARQAQVRAAIRAGLQNRRVTGPRGADRAAVYATNEVLALEGTPPLPEPPPPARATSPADTTATVPAEGYGRHAQRRDGRPT